MKKIAITGGIGSGKTTVSRILKDMDFPVIDADSLTPKAYLLASDELKKTFGEKIFENGEISKPALREIAFLEDNILTLNKILHPKIKTLMEEEMKTSDPIKFFEVSLLFESKMEDIFDKVWLVISPLETRIKRVEKRDNFSREKVLQRIKKQLSDEEKRERSHIIIENDSSFEDLKEKVTRLVATL